MPDTAHSTTYSPSEEIVARAQQNCVLALLPAARERAIRDTTSNRCGDAEQIIMIAWVF